MLLADVFSIAFSIIGFFMSLQGLWLVSRALWPRRVVAAGSRCHHNVISSFVLGAILLLFVGVTAAVTARSLGAPGQLFAFALVGAYVIYANVGVAGLATLIGQRLQSPVDLERPWKATVRGGIALEMAYLLPIVGWLGILPISFIVGAGATTLAFFPKREAYIPPPLPSVSNEPVEALS